VAAALWAAGSVFAGRHHTGMSAGATSAVQMLAGGIVVGVIGAATHETVPTHLSAGMGSSILAVAYLVLFGSLVGFTAYSWLLRSAPISLVSTYAYVNPVVAVLLGVSILGEQLGPLQVVAALVTLAGVALIVSTRARPARR
ncbi:MAG: EamA family transporter, partial [Candidatus Dormibacteraeota bacterium]|nr:EamA family transporter [Candidatus Dormibacteraeota bacterium]